MFYRSTSGAAMAFQPSEDPKRISKDPSMSSLNYERIEADFYQTPSWCTEVLLKHFKPTMQAVWEPACGNGAISKVLLKHRLLVASSDLNDQGYGEPGVNFLTDHYPFKHTDKVIITNPPYKLAEEFVRYATKHFPVTAMLLRNEWDCAKTRIDLFKLPKDPLERPVGFYKKIVLTTRPHWIPGSTGSPRHNYAWYVWIRGYEGAPTIEYGEKNETS